MVRPWPAAAATGRLDELDIRFRQAPDTSLTVPKGAVIRTRPAKGTVLKDDQVVTVVVSAGKPKVPVPEVAGRRAEVAQAELEDRVAALQHEGLASRHAGHFDTQLVALGGKNQRG
jgi:beta-lactam-binding protein with PASTA domain